MIKACLAFAALVPIMTGPLPNDEKSLLIELCSGGQISIPLGNETPADDHPCDPQACHAGTCREKPKKGNLI
ncbi:hypothetical protein INR77_04135 [Erythrobacter sp. SCSIO 43205]|uniref:hypothetical protein n=1 Tax=Erythrobacter sp. SCSIO 43205 TaxID=2779361 RepID=UPI001CA9C5EC|nr:hypothetical protein [Erythrobacter sp. SCSIO 43205]UAB79873.1 hypothetical protein INR77_04135 [Erythrobacter sp. SCSIO 43205]